MYPGVAIIRDLATVYGPVKFSRNRDHYHCEMAIKRERGRERDLEWKNWCKGWEYSKRLVFVGSFFPPLWISTSNPLEDWNQSPYINIDNLSRRLCLRNQPARSWTCYESYRSKRILLIPKIVVFKRRIHPSKFLQKRAWQSKTSARVSR